VARGTSRGPWRAIVKWDLRRKGRRGLFCNLECGHSIKQILGGARNARRRCWACDDLENGRPEDRVAPADRDNQRRGLWNHGAEGEA